MTPHRAAPPFMFDRAAETMPRRDLAALQLARLRQTLARAYECVAPVRRKFDAAGVTPARLGSLADIVRFPFTAKADLRDNYPFGLFAVPREQVLRLHASSGTTGKPTVVGYTKGDLELWADLMARTLACAGARPGDIVHNAYGYGLFTGGLGFHGGAERLGCTVVPVSGGGTERQVALMQDFGATILGATPSYALNIAEVAQAMGVDMDRLPLRRGAFGAEPWSEPMRRDLEARLGIKAVDVYGLSEILGPGVACECDVEQNGLHPGQGGPGQGRPQDRALTPQNRLQPVVAASQRRGYNPSVGGLAANSARPPISIYQGLRSWPSIPREPHWHCIDSASGPARARSPPSPPIRAARCSPTSTGPMPARSSPPPA
jgi:phenylacetate-CoA ligase